VFSDIKADQKIPAKHCQLLESPHRVQT